jgi:hypothetical protein
MTQTQPLTPPPELVASLRNSAPHGIRDAGVTRELWLINSAYAAGADQELEACVALVNDWAQRLGYPHYGAELRAARRPKPPSLKEQALKAIGVPTKFGEARVIEHREHELVRRALEALDD